MTNPDSNPLVPDHRVLMNTALFLTKALSSTTGHDEPMCALKIDLMIGISLSFIDVLPLIGNHPTDGSVAPDDEAANAKFNRTRDFYDSLNALVNPQLFHSSPQL